MASLNRVSLIGNLGKDPDLRYTEKGTPVCNFSLATNESWTDKDGNKQQRTEWHRIVVWGKLAEVCGEYLTKGKQVFIEGKLQTRKWTDQEKIDRWQTEIICREMVMLGQKGDGTAASGRPPDAPIQTDEDIPF